MRTPLLALLLLAACSAHKPPAALPAEAASLGPLTLGMSDEAVEQAVGIAPVRTAPSAADGATGVWIWTWAYSDQGLSLEMSGASATARPTLRSVTAQAPSALRTNRGVGVGSSAAEVRRAYGRRLNADESGAERLVVGSVYGGVIFGLEGDKVSSVVLGGAAAE